MCKNIIIEEAEEITQAWHDSSPEQPPPSSSLSRDGKRAIKNLLKKAPGRYENIRLWNETWDDY